MILSAHQPAYLPWLGYFDKLARSDTFVFLDTVQYEKNSFINRNRIKTAQGPIWLTIPVKTKGHTSSTLRETEIDYSRDWKSKHLKSIRLNYCRAPYYAERYPKLEALYDVIDIHLSDLCFRHLQFWMVELGIKSRLVKASSLSVESVKSDLILDLCKALGATYYISGIFGRQYLDSHKFEAAGVELDYQQFQHPIYPQLHGEFLSGMGIVDAWMNVQYI